MRRSVIWATKRQCSSVNVTAIMSRVPAQGQGQGRGKVAQGHLDLICRLLIFLTVLPLFALGQDSTTIIKTLTMVEEEDVGFSVLNLASDTDLGDKYSDAVLRSLQYSFLPQSQQYSALFTIRPDGDLITASKVDRDDRCPNEDVCEIALDIQVQPVDYFHIIKLTITLIDQNDNPPRFPSDIQLSFPESSAIGSIITITPVAQDPDSPENGIVRYTLDDPSGKFALEVTGDATEGPLEPQLKLLELLDHEVRQQYEMDLTAYDSGSNPQSGSTRLLVQVIDVNDHAATFVNRSYSATIKEDLSRNSPVLTVTAVDEDSGSNGQIIYGFNAPTQDAIADLFDINSQTGLITVIGELDYETKSSYSLTVTARDQVPTSVPDQAKVTITIEDTNDNSPGIVVNNLVGKTAISISEYTPADTFVAHISVKDADSGVNAQFLCQLSSDSFRLEEFYAGEYKVYTKQTFDRELKPRYDVEINCSDKGNPIRSASSTIPFVIKDENDNAPRFSQEKYRKTVLENVTVGTMIMTVEATDPDEGENATVSYSITESSSEIFSINPSTGELFLAGNFDRESRSQETLTVKASDNGHPAQSNLVEVILDVEDVDDEPPLFKQPVYEFAITEHMSGNQKLGKVQATDADTDPYNDFSFSLDPEFNADNNFRIDPVSGELYSMASLDREQVSVYSLHVLATGFDNGDRALSSSAIIKVKVEDINDWPPEFIFPRFSNLTVNITRGLKPGQSFANISAVDRDSGANAKLRYSIVNNRGPFAIDTNTGALSLAPSSSEDSLEEYYRVLIRVQDSGDDPLSAQTQLRINCTAIVHGSRASVLKPQNSTIIIIIIVVSAVVIVGLILGIVCIVRGSCFRGKKPVRVPPQGDEKGDGGEEGALMYSVEYQVQAQYENKGYTRDIVDGKPPTGKKPTRHNSLQISSSAEARSRDPQYLRPHHSDSVQPKASSGGTVLVGGHLHPLPPRAASAPPHQPRPLRIKTSTDDSDQSRDSDSGRGSNEEVASEPGSPRWKDGGAQGGSPPTPPPKLPRRPSLRTSRMLPGIHEGKVLTSDSSAPYDQPPPRPRPYHPPPPPPPPHLQYKDNLPYYKRATPESTGSLTDDDVFHLDHSGASNFINPGSAPDTPSKKRIKHVSQV